MTNTQFAFTFIHKTSRCATWFDIYNDINFWNRRFDRQSCLLYEAIPLVEKIRDFIKTHGKEEQLEKIESKPESLRVTIPEHMKENDGEWGKMKYLPPSTTREEDNDSQTQIGRHRYGTISQS